MNIYKLENDTAMERIRQHYLTGYEITDHDHEIRKRWEAAFSMILDGNPDKDVAKKQAALFGITERQGWNDIQAAKTLFGDLRKSTKESLRYLVTQWAIELYQNAQKKGDWKAMTAALKRITEANNLNRDDVDMPDPSKIQPPVQLLSLSFSFIDSEYFKLIDDKAQQELLSLQEQINKLIERSPVKNYLDMYVKPDQKIIDIDAEDVR